MAKLALTNAFVSLGGTDVSSYVKSVTMPYSADALDATSMGATSRVRIPGLRDWSLQLEFFQDFAAAAIDSILFPLVGTSFTVIVRPTTAAVSATNPNYTGTGQLSSYTPITGAVGEVAMAPVTIEGAGALSRATA